MEVPRLPRVVLGRARDWSRTSLEQFGKLLHDRYATRAFRESNGSRTRGLRVGNATLNQPSSALVILEVDLGVEPRIARLQLAVFPLDQSTGRGDGENRTLATRTSAPG